MSKYTSELRFICESLSGLDKSKGFYDVVTIIKNSQAKIFNFTYPYYSEETKNLFETNFLRCYYTREICEETFGLWQLRLQNKLNLIMPYYIELYKTLELQYNPLFDTDVTTTYTKANSGTNSKTDNTTSKTDNTVKTTSQNTTTDSTTRNTTNSQNATDNSTISSTVTKKNKDRYSDTPQGSLSNLEDNTYLTNARIVDDDTTTNTTDKNTKATTSEGSDTVNGTVTTNMTDNTQNKTDFTNSLISTGDTKNSESFSQTVTGKSGSSTYAQMINDYRKNIININKMIIDDMSDLFILLWE